MTQPSEPSTPDATLACLADEPAFGSFFVSAYPPFSRWKAADLGAFAAALEQAPASEPTPPAAAHHEAPREASAAATTSPVAPAAPPLILYVHLPFCAERCRYCYYLAHDDRGEQIDAYLDALLGEAALYAARPRLAGRRPAAVYFGGGTPSLLSRARLERLLRGLQQAWSWSDAREVTFECAPRSVTPDKLRLLRDAGVTRLSLGVQQLDDEVLARSGRIHRVTDVERAWKTIQSVGFPVTNVDLMTGMVGESAQSFTRSLAAVHTLAPDSVTLYQLEIPLNTPLYHDLVAGQEAPPASWQVKHQRLIAAFDQLADWGYQRISAYAAVRDPQRHPFLYQSLQYRGGDLLGLGVSAFSYLAGVHQQNDTRLDHYLAALDGDRLPWSRAYPLAAEERLIRELVLQLKLGAIDRAWFRARHGSDPAVRFAAVLADHVRHGLLHVGDERIAVNREGLAVIDRLLPSFYLPAHQGGRYS